MPADHRIQKEWLNTQIEEAHQNKKELTPVLQDFKNFIESNPRIYMYFNSMFEEVPRRDPYNKDPTGHRQIRDYHHMLEVLNHTFNSAPYWTDASAHVGMVGVPMCAVRQFVSAFRNDLQLMHSRYSTIPWAHRADMLLSLTRKSTFT